MKRNTVLPFITLLLAALTLWSASCKKSEDPSPADPASADLSSHYDSLGFTHLARLTSSTDPSRFINPGFFITPLDIRKAGGTLKVAWHVREFTYSMPQGLIIPWFGTLSGGRFNPESFAPCGDPSANSSYKRVIRYEIDGQGNLFTSYQWRDITSAALTWQQSFCCSSGLNSGGEWVDYPIETAENNQLVTGVGGAIYNGLEMQPLRYYRFSSTWQGDVLTGLQPEIQGYCYSLTPSGNGFLAYTNRSNGEFDGNMNLAGFDGTGWVNLGQIPLQGIRKVAGINIQTYYEPFKIRAVRNGENPWFLMCRDNNTLAAFRFDGAGLQLVADQVPFPNASFEYVKFCIHNNRVTTHGSSSGTGLLEDKTAVYQLDGNAFSILKRVEDPKATLTGVWSDGTSLWIACEIFSATNGLFYSPIDILELN